jgi:serine/threonine protein kinase
MSECQNNIAGLQVLQEMGIVHRDISTGNIMWYKGVGKLMDLEFSTKYGCGSQGTHMDLTVIVLFSRSVIELIIHLPREHYFSCRRRF